MAVNVEQTFFFSNRNSDKILDSGDANFLVPAMNADRSGGYLNTSVSNDAGKKCLCEAVYSVDNINFYPQDPTGSSRNPTNMWMGTSNNSTTLYFYFRNRMESERTVYVQWALYNIE